jgi:hypothetical protein
VSYRVPETDVVSTALVRHYVAALDAGAMMVAISRTRLTDREPLWAVHTRLRQRLVELIHDFCFNARKAIELAEEYVPGMIDHADGILLPGYGESGVKLDLMRGVEPLANQSLWWLLGRVIHSRQLAARDQEDVEVGTKWKAAPGITVYRTLVAFEVRSERDGLDQRHLVYVDRPVEAFFALGEKFNLAIDAVRAANPCGDLYGSGR